MSGQVISAQLAQAFNRFGLGGRPDDPVPADPVAWLSAQLVGPDPLSYATPNLSTCLGWVNTLHTAQPGSPQQAAARAALVKHTADEASNFLWVAVTTTTPFRERLVRFWSNHFALLGSNETPGATAGTYVRDAIRPNLTGTFQQMLQAVMAHPAMLTSLNNDVSVGPNSPLGLRNHLGINENLGRETLELYTLGVAAGYTEADVSAMSLMLTGWTVNYSGQGQGFTFDNDMHEPGPQTLLGTSYDGPFNAYAALDALGTHQATYGHIAFKLAQHFTVDTPTDADVQTLKMALVNNGGSLAAVYAALIAMPSTWNWEPLDTKLRSPQDFVIAAMRAVTSIQSIVTKTGTELGNLGEPTWRPPFPNGYSDVGQDWASSSQMAMRTNWISLFCSHYAKSDPAATAMAALGGNITQPTTLMMGRVLATHDKLTILFCSPDFQRR